MNVDRYSGRCQKEEGEYNMTRHVRATLSAALLAAASATCAWANEAGSAVAVVAEEGVPGGAIVAAQGATATVAGIAAETRKITLTMPGGKQAVYKAGPAVANFDQIKVGDRIKVVAIEALAVALRKGDEPLKDNAAAGVALAPLGDKPGMLVGNAVELHATVKALDTEKRTGTLELADGSKKTVSVRPDVDMARIAVGDKVSIRLVELLAIQVQAPE